MSIRHHCYVPPEHLGRDHPGLHGRHHLRQVHRAKEPRRDHRLLQKRRHHHQKRVPVSGMIPIQCNVLLYKTQSLQNECRLLPFTT